MLVADPVIKAITRTELEEGLRTEVLCGGCIKPRSSELLDQAQDQFETPLGVRVGLGGDLVIIWILVRQNSNQI